MSLFQNAFYSGVFYLTTGTIRHTEKMLENMEANLNANQFLLAIIDSTLHIRIFVCVFFVVKNTAIASSRMWFSVGSAIEIYARASF